ncbi:MAG TPA: SPOR domain-containing protein [Candidatus Marinimicrobia bacterium]|jgi:cell division septation protein DedD|nr:SPOR domain-containing protein [Candidatus Neomarinimicrobiota bacterium]
MKKLSLTLAILLMLLGNCTKKPVVTGTVGYPVNVVPEIKKSEDTTGCTFKWGFVARPAESIMDVLSFIPDSRSFSVSFIPDVPGDYELQFLSQDSNGKEIFKQIIKCSISYDTAQSPSADTVVDQMPPRDLPDTAQSPSTDTVASQMPPRDLSAPPPQYAQSYPGRENETTYSAMTQSQPIKTGKNIQKIPGKYTIQLGAYKNYDKAEAELRKLRAYNLDTYIQKAYFKETNETCYRIRTGTFDSYAEAKKVLNQLKARFPKENLWIDFVCEDQ